MDLVPVADVAASVERLGRRYLYRVFTPHERACARIGRRERPVRPAPTRHESLAARFAAKEAAVKVLRPTGARPEWRSIEVHRAVGGWCELRLSGLAARLAAEAGITDPGGERDPRADDGRRLCRRRMSRGDATAVASDAAP